MKDFSETAWMKRDFYALARLRWILSESEWKMASKKIPLTEKWISELLSANWSPSYPPSSKLYESLGRNYWSKTLSHREEKATESEAAIPLLLSDILQKLISLRNSNLQSEPGLMKNLLKLEQLLKQFDLFENPENVRHREPTPPIAWDRLSFDPLLAFDLSLLTERFWGFLNDPITRGRLEDRVFPERLFHARRLFEITQQRIRSIP